MVEILKDWIKGIKEKMFCRNCNNYTTFFAIGIIYHLKKVHNSKPTKDDLKLLLGHNCIARLFKFLVACVLIPPIFILKHIFCFLGMIGEDIL
jgi:hypothetical protein